MAGIQLSGLASNFDWKSFVDQIIGYERAPATRMQSDIGASQLKLTALSGVETRINDLRAAVKALDADEVFGARAAGSSNASWSATASRWTGGADLGSPLAASADVSGLTIASLGTATAPSAGAITVNGHRVEVGLADSLADVFSRIATATGNTVSASYDPLTDRVTLAGSGPIVLGSASDSSNLLSVLRLANNGGASVTSSAALGAVSTGATLAGARLATPVTAVDAEGKGAFSINGVEIAYDVDSDSLASVLARINASAAGVTARYDPLADQVSLVNKATGDLGVSLQEAPGGLLAALRLTTASGASLARGVDAQFTVNGGATLTSRTNTLTEEAHGIAGLSVSPSESGGAATITVGTDSAGPRARIEAFISAFNSLQGYIESQTKVTSTNGKVTTSTLSDNREVQSWGGQLRAAVFDAVPGLGSAISRLDHLGIDFTGTSSTLAIKDSAKLDAALRDKPAEVAAYFRQASTGLAARLDKLFSSYLGPFGGAGLLGGQRTQLTEGNNSLTKQIADLDRRLEQRRALLESGFIAMERAQSTLQQMQAQLTRAFPVSSK